jgi:hypothetical protein
MEGYDIVERTNQIPYSGDESRGTQPILRERA